MFTSRIISIYFFLLKTDLSEVLYKERGYTREDKHLTQNFFIGVDGGATKCTIRLEDESGRLLGQAISGTANIRISVDETWQSINSALNQLLKPNGLNLEQHQFHVGMGLAGCEVAEAYKSFIDHNHQFHTLIVSSDAHTACLGAHKGGDGAIINIGTGTVGFAIHEGKIIKVSGWGFPHDDEGGGAWLGLQAVKMTLQSLDGRLPMYSLAKAIFGHFGDDQERLVSFANQANSSAFASLTPFVIRCAQSGDKQCASLLHEAAFAIDKLGQALFKSCPLNLPCVLIGGVAPFLEPYLGKDLHRRLSPCQASPDVGAVMLVKQHLSG